VKAKFSKGKQREFINEVLVKIGCPSLRELFNRGLGVSYSSLKNYYSERRLMSLILVEDLCKVSGIEIGSLNFEIFSENWGQIKGGRTKNKF